MRKGLKYLLFALVLATLFFSNAEKAFQILPENSLNGSFTLSDKPTVSLDNWIEGVFQNDLEQYVREHVGGHSYLVRLRNQYYYSLFHRVKANSAVAIKNDVLIDHAYVDAFYGNDFAGDEFLNDKLKRWKRVQHGLDSIGVKAFLALAPGKGSYFEDLLTEEVRSTHKPMTNHKFIAEWAKNEDLNLLDLKTLYHSWIDTSIYPLFPKGGIHWSEYGVAHVCDTLRGYIQGLTGRTLQKFWFNIEVADEARKPDNDIALGINLLFPLVEKGLAYPIRYFGEDSTIVPTKFLVIGDSYYYNIFYSGFADRICSHGGFWYYFEEAYPDVLFQHKPVEGLDILEELKKQDVLMLMMTEPQLPRFGWGAVEELEAILYPEKREDPLSETSR